MSLNSPVPVGSGTMSRGLWVGIFVTLIAAVTGIIYFGSGTMSGGLLVGIIFTSIAAVAAIVYFHIVVRRIENALSAPNLKEYTFATALYPDALIIKFGVEQKFR